MRKAVLVSLFILVLMGFQTIHAVTFDAGGGLSVALYVPDLGFIDGKLQEVTPGFEDADKPIVTWGGLGYVKISDKFRIGGYGFGGYKTISGAYINGSQAISQDVYYEMSGGGFYTEYLLPVFHSKFESVVTLGIGGAGFTMRINQIESTVTWDNILDQLTPGNDRKSLLIEMETGGFLIQPGVSVKYYLNKFFAVEANVNYMLFLLESDWEFCGTKVRNMPDHSLSAPVLGLRFIFGG